MQLQLGWIDYSKTDRQKVLSVIDLLSEDGTLDELGIAPIRDGFANLFFPGTSTIQTRAKYFLIVPYALISLARQHETDYRVLLRKLDEIERKCGEILLARDAEGTIGRRTLRSGSWVKRTPSDIYWAGIRQFGIYRGNFSLTEYARSSCKLATQKQDLGRLGHHSADAPEHAGDDPDAGLLFSFSFWKVPTYQSNWMDNLEMELTFAEAKFLQEQIVLTQPASLLSYILENKLHHLPELEGFMSLEHIIRAFPAQLRADYALASAFSHFIFGARIRYNIILSEGKNQKANEAWNSYLPNLTAHASLDLPAIFARLKVRNPKLRHFLTATQSAMLDTNITALDDCIKKREIDLKGASRAKLNRAGEFRVDAWIGGGHLDYRFRNAMVLINDIFQGLGVATCSSQAQIV